MASIGKISAAVVINTADVAPRLGSANRAIQQFASGVQSSLSSASNRANRAFDSIFTAAQRLERAFAAATLPQINLVNPQQVALLRDLVGSAERVARPLGDAARAFNQLSAASQGAFEPALERAQTSARALQQELQRVIALQNEAENLRSRAQQEPTPENTQAAARAATEAQEATARLAAFLERSFSGTVNQVNRVTEAIQRLGEVERAVAANRINTRSLAFANPQLLDELQRGGRITGQIQGLSAVQQASLRDPIDLRNQQVRATEVLQAQLERVQAQRAAGGARDERGRFSAADLAQEERRLTAELANERQVLRDINTELERRVRLALEADRIDAVGGEGAASDRDPTGRTIQQRAEDIRRLREAEAARAEVQESLARNQINTSSLVFSDPRGFEVLQRREQLFGQLGRVSPDRLASSRGSIDSLNAAGRNFEVARSELENVRELGADETAALAAYEAATAELQRQVVALERVLDLEKQLADEGERRAAAQRQYTARVDDFEFRATGQFQNLGQARSGSEALLRQSLELTPEQLRSVGAEYGRLSSALSNNAPIQELQQAFDGLNLRLKEFADQASKPLGLAIDDPTRRLGVLEGSIVSLKGKLDQLPAPLQNLFSPALIKAEEEFNRLKNSSKATAQEIANAAEEVRRLQQNVSAAAKLNRPDGLFPRNTPDAAVKDFEGLEKAGQFFNSNIGEARRALDEYRAAAQKAIAEGTIGVPAVRDSLESLRKKYVEVAAAAAGVTPAKFLATARNFGDVGRAGADKFALALNQLAFVFDDLTSATGGLDMKFRAIQNNLTQIGFILGSTTGLWIALSAAIGGQVVIQVIKWLYQTDLQKARLKELNDALKAQESSVQSLADAYRRLAQEIARAGATGFEARSSEREEKIQELRRASQERQKQSAAELSPEVATIRGERAILEERLQGERNLERRIRLSNEIARKRRDEEAAVARGVTAPTRDEFTDTIRDAQRERIRQTEIRLTRARLREELGGEAPEGEDVRTLEAELRQREKDRNETVRRALGAGENRRQQLGLLRESLAELEQQRERVVISGGRTSEIDDAIDRVATAIRRIEANLAPAVQRVVEEFTRQSLSVAATIEDGARFIADQLGDSQEARDIRRALRATADEVSRLQTAVNNATTPEEAEEARNTLSRSRRNAERLRERAQQTAEAAAVDPQRSFASILDRVRSNLSDGGAQQGALARRARELAARRETLVQNLESENPFVRRRAERELQELDNLARNLEAASIAVAAFGEVLNRIARESEAALESARQAQDAALRDRIRRGGVLPGGEEDFARRDFERQREADRRVQQAIADQRARIEEQGDDPVLQELRELREREESGTATADDRRRRAELERVLDNRVNASPEVRAAREESIRQQERAESRRRGRDALLDPFGAEAFRQQLRDVRRAALEDIGDAGVIDLPDAERRAARDFAGRGIFSDIENARLDAAEAAARAGEAAQGLFGGDQARQREVLDNAQRAEGRAAAPLIAGFFDSVQNAILGGPSRAALTATDASTVEGARELNRLLRGDDPARDVNYQELLKQTAALEQINKEFNGVRAQLGLAGP